MKKQVALVVFDIAGTTVKDNGEIAWAFQKALATFDYDVPVSQINPLMGYEKREAIRTMLEEHEQNSDRITKSLIAKIHERFLEEMIQHYQTTTALEPLPGAQETFRELKNRGIKIGLNTGFSKDITDVILQRLAWFPEIVDFVISSSQVGRGRPFPFMIQYLMHQAGLTDAKQVVKVGDTEVDVREGQNARCLYSIGVTTGSFTREALQPFEPSFILDNLTDLLPILDHMPQYAI